jgi:rhodanese-related sulfurtransferase
MSQSYSTISRRQLEQKLNVNPPANEDRQQGYALVNVLGKDAFDAAHIPQSINIPLGQEALFEQHFAKDKEIVVYCASPNCDASPKVAQALADRGFTWVLDYEGGISDWKNAGNKVIPS